MNPKIAEILLKIKAVHLQPDNFFTWTSGIKSPIYCDNRQIISYPQHRKVVVDEFVDYIKTNFPDTEVIAGTATAGIPWAAWIADELNLPLVYIRGESKGHGLKNAIEGKVEENQKVLIIEDLISTGKSSIAAANEAKSVNLEVAAVLSIFTYGFDKARIQFEASNLDFFSLCDLDSLLQYAKDQSLLTNEQIAIISQWKMDQEN
jgi:orotate phosphoribosyltransferase